jgi:ferrochelatase
MTSRRAIVLMNLGGPDSLDAVRPFLFNLFNDKAIFRLPQPFRAWLAAFVAKRRAPIAAEIYRHLGGGSPLLPNTEAQAAALHAALGGADDIKIFIAMRYWHPFTAQTVADVQSWNPDEIILLPLYPQFSTTTTASSIGAWRETARSMGLKIPTRTICCYPFETGFIEAMARLIAPVLAEGSAHGQPRLLLSAHGLPERVVAAGDPYQWQCEQTAAAIVAALIRADPALAGLAWTVCYQSRVGPLTWIGPSTEAEIRRAGSDGAPVVIAPIAFVSEHSETLVELDIEYRELALSVGVPHFGRAPTAGTDADFIAALARLARLAADDRRSVLSGCGERLCPAIHVGCPIKETLSS